MNAEQAIRYPRGERIAARLPPEVVDLFTNYSLLRAPPTALVLAKLVREQRVGLHRGVLTEAGRDLDVYLTIKEKDDRRARADARNASAPPPDTRTDTTATGGGATLSFVRGWHQAVATSAHLIAEPGARLAYLEAQLVRLGLELEAPCGPR